MNAATGRSRFQGVTATVTSTTGSPGHHGVAAVPEATGAASCTRIKTRTSRSPTRAARSSPRSSPLPGSTGTPSGPRPSRRAATPCCSPACGGRRRRDRHHRPGRLRGPPRRRLEDQQDRGGCRVPVGRDGAGQVQGSRARAPAGTRPGEQQRPVHAVDPADGSTDAAGTSGSQRLVAGARRRHRSVAHQQRADAPSGIFRQMLLRAPFMSQRGDASRGVAGGLVAGIWPVWVGC